MEDEPERWRAREHGDEQETRNSLEQKWPKSRSSEMRRERKLRNEVSAALRFLPRSSRLINLGRTNADELTRYRTATALQLHLATPHPLARAFRLGASLFRRQMSEVSGSRVQSAMEMTIAQ